MATFILLSKLTPEGRKTIKEKPNRISEVNKEVEGFGAKVKSQYAVLGPFDFVTVLEAPDARTVGRISAELSSRGTVEITSLVAIPADEFISDLGKKKK